MPKCQPSLKGAPTPHPNSKPNSATAVFQPKMFVVLISSLDWEKATDKGRSPERCVVASTPFGFGGSASPPKASQDSTGVARAERSLKRLRNWRPEFWTTRDVVPRTVQLIGARANWPPS